MFLPLMLCVGDGFLVKPFGAAVEGNAAAAYGGFFQIEPRKACASIVSTCASIVWKPSNLAKESSQETFNRGLCSCTIARHREHHKLPPYRFPRYTKSSNASLYRLLHTRNLF